MSPWDLLVWRSPVVAMVVIGVVLVGGHVWNAAWIIAKRGS